jgi:hypothetical protein
VCQDALQLDVDPALQGCGVRLSQPCPWLEHQERSRGWHRGRRQDPVTGLTRAAVHDEVLGEERNDGEAPDLDSTDVPDRMGDVGGGHLTGGIGDHRDQREPQGFLGFVDARAALDDAPSFSRPGVRVAKRQRVPFVARVVWLSCRWGGAQSLRPPWRVRATCAGICVDEATLATVAGRCPQGTAAGAVSRQVVVAKAGSAPQRSTAAGDAVAVRQAAVAQVLRYPAMATHPGQRSAVASWRGFLTGHHLPPARRIWRGDPPTPAWRRPVPKPLASPAPG